MSRPKILLVDDNRLFLEMEKGFLQTCAVTVFTARSGQEALDIVRIVRPDLVFMDLHMPGMDGDICCATLKDDPDLKQVPVVMIITGDGGDDVRRCREAGCDHILVKPVDRRIFISTGHRFLAGIDTVEERFPCLTLVVFRIGSETRYGTSANLSTQGMFIACDSQVAVDDLVRVTFLVPGSDGDLVDADCRVAWLNEGSPLRNASLPKGFGVEFQRMGSEGATAIARFLERSRTSGVEAELEGAYQGEALF